jgi:hypothetical protein
MRKFIIAVFVISILSSCNNQSSKDAGSANQSVQQTENKKMDFNILDAYKLTLEKTFLYGDYSNFISVIGLPDSVTVFKTKFLIDSKAALEKAVLTAKDPDVATLHYPGIDMWYSYNNSIIPFTIDFRKTTKSVSYGETLFDSNYTFEQFKRQFPISATPSVQMPGSLFGLATKEKGEKFKHFLLKRKSKDDPNAEPLVEFTFENNKLIFVMFANF